MSNQYTSHKISRLSSKDVLLNEIARLKSENNSMKDEYLQDKKDIKDLRKKVMKSQKKVIKLCKVLKGQKQEAADLKKEYEEYVELAEGINEETTQEIESLKLVNYDLNEKFKRLYNENAKLSSTKISVKSENQITRLVLGFGRIPRSIQEIIGFMETFFGDMLVFSEEAIDNKKHFTLTQLDDAWVLIKSLPFLWELLYDRKDTDFVNTFKSTTDFRFSLGETSYFKKNPNKMKDRKFTFDDGVYECLWHIGKMTHDYGVSMRCYFYPDSSIEKIRVGYLGEHL